MGKIILIDKQDIYNLENDFAFDINDQDRKKEINKLKRMNRAEQQDYLNYLREENIVEEV